MKEIEKLLKQAVSSPDFPLVEIQTSRWNGWDRKEAIGLLTKLEPFLANMGFHCALAGSVLYRGYSDKDLDVIVYPHNVDKCQTVDEIWCSLVTYFAPEECGRCSSQSSTQLRDGKTVRWLKKDGQRIDFFFLK